MSDLKQHLKYLLINDHIMLWMNEISNHNAADRASIYLKFEDHAHSDPEDLKWHMKEAEVKYKQRIAYAKCQTWTDLDENLMDCNPCPLDEHVEKYAEEAASKYLANTKIRKEYWGHVQKDVQKDEIIDNIDNIGIEVTHDQFITLDEKIRGGIPCVKNTRFPISQLIAEMNSMGSLDKVVEEFELNREDCQQAVWWACWWIGKRNAKDLRKNHGNQIVS